MFTMSSQYAALFLVVYLFLQTAIFVTESGATGIDFSGIYHIMIVLYIKVLSNFEIFQNLEMSFNFNQMVWIVIYRPSLFSHRPTRLYFLSAPPLLRYEYREAFVAIQPT